VFLVVVMHPRVSLVLVYLSRLSGFLEDFKFSSNSILGWLAFICSVS